MLLIEGDVQEGGGEGKTSNRKERQANHIERSVTYLHIMARIGLVNEIRQSSSPKNGN